MPLHKSVDVELIASSWTPPKTPPGTLISASQSSSHAAFLIGDCGKLQQFDEKTAGKVLEDGVGDEDDERSAHTFYINIDNIFLQTDMKGAKSDVIDNGGKICLRQRASWSCPDS